MPARSELEILLSLRDQATRQLKQAGLSTRSFEANLKSLAQSAAIAGASLIALGYGLSRLAEDAAKIDTARQMLEGLAKASDSSADAILANMERATRGMLSNAQMISVANRAIAGIGPWFEQELPRAMQAAIAAWKAGGGSFEFYADSIVRGIGRLSPLILDNLFATVGVAEATDRFAQELVEESGELSKTEQQMALYNLMMEKMRLLMDASAQTAGGFDEEMQRLRAEIANTKEAIGRLLIPALKDVIPTITDTVEAFGMMPVEMQKQAAETAGVLAALLVAFRIFGFGVFQYVALPIAAVYLLRKAFAGIANILDPTVQSYEELNETFMQFLERNLEGFLQSAGLGAEAMGGDIVKAYKDALAEVRAERVDWSRILAGEEAAAQIDKATAALTAFTAAGEASAARMAKWSAVEYEQWIAQLERSILANKIWLNQLRAGTAIYKDTEANLKGLEKELKLVEMEYELLFPAAAEGAKAFATSISELIDALTISHPLVRMLSASIAGLEVEVAAQEAAQRSLSVAIHQASRAYAEAQERVSQLSQQLAEARRRMDELARPRLVGMGALENQIRIVEEYIKRVRLAQLMRQPIPTMPGLPANIKALEKMLEILRLRWEVEFDPLLRQLAAAAEPTKPEITFEDALRQIEITRGTISDLERQLDSANAALASQKAHMDDLQEASFWLGQAIAATRDLLEEEKAKRDLVIEGLSIAYKWILQNRKELIESGKVSQNQALEVDKALMQMFDAFNLTSEGKSITTVNYIENIVERIKKMIDWATAMQAKMAGGGGNPTGMQVGGKVLQGGWAVVGEKGPELLRLPGGSQVFPRVSAGGTISLVINIGVLAGDEVSARRLARVILEHIRDEERRGG